MAWSTGSASLGKTWIPSAESRYPCFPLKNPLPRSFCTCRTRVSRSAVGSTASEMIPSATANSGATAISSGPYSPTHSDVAGYAVRVPARACRNRRNPVASAANGRSALKLSITSNPGRRSRRIATMRPSVSVSASW